MKLLFTWWLFYCHQIICCTKHEIEKKRRRKKQKLIYTFMLYPSNYLTLTPNLILDEERKHLRIYMCSLFFNYTFCIYVGNQNLPANFGRNPTKGREKQWLQVDPLLWMMIVLNGCKLTTNIWRDCASQRHTLPTWDYVTQHPQWHYQYKTSIMTSVVDEPQLSYQSSILITYPINPPQYFPCPLFRYELQLTM